MHRSWDEPHIQAEPREGRPRHPGRDISDICTTSLIANRRPAVDELRHELDRRAIVFAGGAPAGADENDRCDPNGPPPAIRVRGLRHRYASGEVLRGLDLDVRHREVYAVLGPNGAGKTTTIEILEGFLTPTAGDVRVLGTDPATAPAAWRDRVGIVLQDSEPDPDLTVAQTLELYAGYHSRPRHAA